MNSTLQIVNYLFSKFKNYISEEYSNRVQQNEFKLGQAIEDKVKGYIEASKGARDFIQFYEEALGTTYTTKYQCKVFP